VRRLPIALLAALLAGCGTALTRPGPEGGAALAPRSSALLVRLDTRSDSAQSRAVESLLRLLPAGRRLQLAIAQARSALGPETDALALTADDLDAGTFLALTQPRDEVGLDTLLAKNGLVSEEVQAWRVIARDRRSIDRLKIARNGGSLAGNERYREATAGLPVDALATAYLDGVAATAAIGKRATVDGGPVPGLGRIAWVSAAVGPKQDGLSVEVRVKGDEIESAQYVAELPAEVPAGAALFVDTKGLNATLDELKRSPAFSDRLGPAAKALGPLLDEVIRLFEGEAAFYVRPAAEGPEATLVVKVGDEQAAEATLDRLATLVGALGQRLPESLRVAGVRATRLVVGKRTLYYAVFDGKVVVTTSESGIRGLVAATPRLADSPAWRSATADLPEEVAGLAYVDAPRAMPLLARLGLGGARDNLAPLRTVFLYASVDRDRLSVKGFGSIIR
jgi:hypothetical protein